jgi:primosomal protein N' (replication factor Y)
VAEPPRFVEVALPLPLFQTFTYAVDGAQCPVANRPVPGTRVVVPFRTGRAIGICVGTTDTPPPRGVAKPIIDIPDAEPAVTPGLMALCRWMAEYYVVPLGIALRSALPALLTGAAAPTPAPKTHRIATLREAVPSLLQRTHLFARSPKQRALYELLESLGGRANAAHLVELLNCTPSVLTRLVERGLVEIEDHFVDRDPFAARAVPGAMAHTPTAAQCAALAALAAAAPGEVALLHGVTGSGKTLVYVDFLREIVDARGQTAIVLVPEIALTPQTVDRFRAVFGDRVAVLHSALSDGERYDAWRALRSGVKRIAVGARSAVFAPLERLGAIIVDEEHEASYKQGEAPRYHAREVALVRAQHAGAVVVLGSATPSLESWSNARAGKYRLLTLPERVGGARLPAVEVVDLRQPAGAAAPGRAAGMPPLPPLRAAISEPLERALRETLSRHEQAILLLNRRGYAAFVQCPGCGDVAVCPNCSISLTYHRTPEQLVCHYCRHHEPARTSCPRCGEATLRRRGLGTQQLERLVAEHFPEARIARMDVDTTGAKWAHADILDRVGRGEVDILLGTQMIAKGLDFPNVTLVGVIDADVGINLPDFRASERCFQLLSQVAGRAGRRHKGGRVYIQTRLPMHHAVRCAVHHDYAGFVSIELPARSDPPYPPTVRIANVIFSGPVEGDVARLAVAGAAWLQRLLASRGISGVTAIGPAPCPVERITTRWRWHVLLKAEHPAQLTQVARYLVRRFPVPAGRGLRVTLDRDPVALL